MGQIKKLVASAESGEKCMNHKALFLLTCFELS